VLNKEKAAGVISSGLRPISAPTVDTHRNFLFNANAQNVRSSFDSYEKRLAVSISDQLDRCRFLCQRERL